MLEQLITDHLDLWTSAIKPRSITGRGSNSRIELTGIKKLRELILELAVRGLLVPQDPNDEPASVLLEKIAAEKAQLIKDGKIKKQMLLPSINEEELPYKLPLMWEWKKLPDISFFQEGPGILAKDFRNTGVPLIRIAGMKGDVVSLDGCNYLDDKMVKEKWAHFKLDLDDIVLSSSASLGKVSKVASDTVGCIVYTGLIRFKTYQCLYDAYLIRFLCSNEFVRQINQSKTGAAIQHFGPSHLKNMIVPLPPLAEQHRIAAKVDELMALCDQLEQQQTEHSDTHHTLVTTLLESLSQASDADQFQAVWSQLFAHFDTLFTTEASIDQLKQTILQLAVMGKLVPQDPNDEPASVLLEKIAAEEAQLIKDGKIKKQKPLPSINHRDVGFNSPDGWVWSRMGDLAQYQKGYAFKSKDYLDSGLMITKIQNLTENHIQNSVYINPERASDYDQYLLFEGDIVMTTVGSWFSAPLSAVGRAFLINKLFNNSLLNQNAVRISSYKEVNPMYLFACINSSAFKDYLVHEAQGTANQASITQESIKNFLICIPPKEEQRRIVAKVDELMALCDQLKIQLNEAQTTQQHLAEAIVQQAVA